MWIMALAVLAAFALARWTAERPSITPNQSNSVRAVMPDDITIRRKHRVQVHHGPRAIEVELHSPDSAQHPRAQLRKSG